MDLLAPVPEVGFAGGERESIMVLCGRRKRG